MNAIHCILPGVSARLISFLLTCSFLWFVSSTANSEDALIHGKVIGISDADTIKVFHSISAVTVRLYGIDAPESHQPYAKRAKAFVSELAFNQDVSVRIMGREKFGRTLGIVTLHDGRILNHEILRAGYAWWYERFAPNDRELKELEESARSSKRGLWKDPSPTPPWEFRKSQK